MNQVESIEKDEVLREVDRAVSERHIVRRSVILFSNNNVIADGEVVDRQTYIGKGRNIRCEGRRVLGEYTGDRKSYQMVIHNKNVGYVFNGITVKYRVSGWESIRYIAVGHTAYKAFRHIKIPNPKQGEWVIFSLCYNDLAYRMMNSWVNDSPMAIDDFRVYVSGRPSESGARIEVAWASAWHDIGKAQGRDAVDRSSCPELLERLKIYFLSCNPSLNQQAERFIEAGDCPMTGDVVLPWEPLSPTPDGMSKSGTYRYLWHAMHPVITLLVYGDNNNVPSAIYAARDYVNSWIDSSYLRVDPDSKYTWYDHGTAERLLAFLMMYEIGRKHKFDYRFMTRLSSVIVRHGQLLESESFYALHQPTRYHNHAWFQDLALVAAALGMSDLACSRRWLDRAIERLEDQFRSLIVHDGPYFIFSENSIGYHLGVERLTKFASELVTMSGVQSEIPGTAEGLTKWSRFFVYPDGRRPSQGDTFRQPNPVTLSRKPTHGSGGSGFSFTALPKAGYTVVKGNHEARPFMVCMFATSRSKTHKHEDDLSFTLFFDGIEWLIDPSMYSHDYTDTVPAYLRSSIAHNMVAIPGLDYRIEPGSSNLTGTEVDNEFVLSGHHSAYRNILVSRKILGSFDKLILRGEDDVRSALGLDHSIYHVFHLGEGVRVARSGNEIMLSHNSSQYGLRVSGLASTIVREGLNHDDGLISVAGQGFMECVDTVSMYTPMINNSSIQWCLEAVRYP